MGGGRHDITDTSRDPCPHIIVYDVGVGFCMGAIGGAIWHGFKGYRNSPRGDRLAGALSSLKARSPVLGGNFAVWSGLFNAGDCTLVAIRGKEDSWNAIMAGAATGGILAARSGPRAIAVSAAIGGIILGVMEGVGAMIGRMQADQYKPVAPPIDMSVVESMKQQQQGQPATTNSSSPATGSEFVSDPPSEKPFKSRFFS
ncbi:translocase of the inner membrane [Blyttiomyces sp. JEL0837]|nr:translocase of the inner membrane [Blyttiomyces sp. JEL0837]